MKRCVQFLRIEMVTICAVVCLLTGCSSTDNSPTSSIGESLTGWTKSFKKPSEPEQALITSQQNGRRVSDVLTKQQKRENLQIALARSLEKQGRLPQAVQAYERAVEDGVRDITAMHRLAVLYDKASEFEKANQLYRQALAIQPNNPQLLSDQGYSFYLQARYSEAEEALRKALTLDRYSNRAHNNLAMTLARTQRYDEAFSEFKKAGCDITEAHVNLAYVMMWKGNLQSAAEEFEMALAIDASSQPARVGLERLHALAKQRGLEPPVGLDENVSETMVADNAPNTPSPSQVAGPISQQPSMAPLFDLPSLESSTNSGAAASSLSQPTAKMATFTSQWPRK